MIRVKIFGGTKNRFPTGFDRGLKGFSGSRVLKPRVSAFTFKTPTNSRIAEILTAKAKKAHKV
jgi:hypothetical protein